MKLPGTMKALRFDAGLTLAEIPLPHPPPGEALVRVRRAGICNTDIEIVRGYMGFAGTLGHEFVGEVVTAFDPALVGRRVVGEINAACGECELCRRGLSHHCPHRTVLGILGRDGAFAEYLTLPEENLHSVPDEVSDEAAVFVEPLAAALEILEQVHIEPSWRIAVVGDGKLGLLIAQVLDQAAPGGVAVLGRHEAKLKIARGLGLHARIVTEPEGDGYDLVVECSGSPDGFATAVSLTRPRGVLVLKSTYHGPLNYNPAAIVIYEITVVGSRCGPFAPALEMLAAGRIDVAPLHSAIFSLTYGLAAFERAQEPGALKVTLEM